MEESQPDETKTVIRWRGMNKPPLGSEPIDLHWIRRNLGFDEGTGGMRRGSFRIKKEFPKGKTKQQNLCQGKLLKSFKTLLLAEL